MVQWDGVYLHRNGRHHVWGLLVEDEIVQSLYLYLFVTDDIGGNELAVASFLIESLYGSIFDAGELADDGLHLFQLDAETTNLYLSVAAAHKLDISVWQVAHDVACSIDANIFVVVGKWIADIYLCCFLRTV